MNATTNDVRVCERVGFEVTGPRREMRGIAFVPMALHLDMQVSD